MIEDHDLRFPSLKRCLACGLYEGVLLFGVVFITGYLFSALTQTRHALDNRHELQAFVFITLGIYFTWFWAKGQTLAMKTWHIKVVDAFGNPLTQTRALMRYLLAWIWFMPSLMVSEFAGLSSGASFGLCLLWIGTWALLSKIGPDGQFLHDRICGTRLTLIRP